LISTRSWITAALLAPAVVVFAGFFLLPQAGLLQESFSRPAPFGVAAYVRFLGDPYYLAMLGRTLMIGVSVAAICFVFGFPLAFWLARLESRFVPFLLLLVTFPLWVSSVVRSFAWMVLFFHKGALSTAVRATGLVGDDFQLMGTLSGVVVALGQVLLPIMIVTLYGVIRTIDRDLENAAMNLGASPLKAVYFVTIRLAAGGITAGTLLVFSLAVGAFSTPTLIGGARAQLLAVAIQEQTLEMYDWPFAAAISAILLVISVATAVIYAQLTQGRADQ